MIKMLRTGLLAFLLYVCAGCSNDNPFPKPQGYPRIAFPEKAYLEYNSPCGYSFNYPAYATVKRDSAPDAEPCWINVTYPELNAVLHISYKPVSSFKNFYDMAEDARTFAYKHTVKAEDIIDSAFYTPGRVSGVFYDIEGNAASSLQFYATDSVDHYLRAALYFNTHPNKDSLAPVVQFIKADMDTMIRSLKWKALPKK